MAFPRTLDELTNRILEKIELLEGGSDISPSDALISMTTDEITTYSELNARKEQMVFVCVPCDEAEHVVENSTIKECEKCFRSVYMSPATEMAMRRLDHTIILCWHCSGLSDNLKP